MRILLSNDDGIHAPGLAALHEALRDLGEVLAVAPDSERSAVGHAITLYDPIKCRAVEKDGTLFGYAASGTPADCVKMAVCALLPRPPDLVVSGINLGSNTGISIIYSGTVSAATEGTILGIPSLAISLTTFTNPQWATAAAIARRMVLRITEKGLPKGCLLNVNVPNLPVDELRGQRVTRMGHSRFIETFDRRTDPRGNIYYWMDGALERIGDGVDTDLEAIDQGFVSVTPIGIDLTRHEAMDRLRADGFGD